MWRGRPTINNPLHFFFHSFSAFIRPVSDFNLQFLWYYNWFVLIVFVNFYRKMKKKTLTIWWSMRNQNLKSISPKSIRKIQNLYCRCQRKVRLWWCLWHYLGIPARKRQRVSHNDGKTNSSKPTFNYRGKTIISDAGFVGILTLENKCLDSCQLL